MQCLQILHNNIFCFLLFNVSPRRDIFLLFIPVGNHYFIQRRMLMQTAPKKVVTAWAMYDWANSAYNLVITSTIFPTYFEAIAVDNKEISKTTVTFLGRQFANTSLYNYALAVAFLIVAIISPLLSSIADYKGNKKKFLGFFLAMGSIACAALFFFKDKSTLTLGIVSMIIACVGFWASLVFITPFFRRLPHRKTVTG